MSIEAMKQMVEALEINLVFLRKVKPFKGQEDLIIECGVMTEEMIAAGRQAIAEAEKQEPVGEAYLCDRCHTPFNDAWECPSCGHNMAVKEPVYTSPPQRQPLTDEQLRSIENTINPNMRWRSSDEEGITLYPSEYYDLVRAIEAAHGIKENNNG